MKYPLLIATALVMTAGSAMAGSGHANKWNGRHGPHAGGVTPFERVQIANARAHLAGVRARAWRDGRVTVFERFQIRSAETRLARVIARSRYS